jgi:hypothetical protein
MPVKNILIVDRDLGFVLWLGHILNARGTTALPATKIADASELVSLLNLRVDVLIASPGEEGFREFAAKLRARSPDLQVVGLGGEEDPAWIETFPDAVWRDKPQCGDEATRLEWVTLVDELAHRHLSLAYHS